MRPPDRRFTDPPSLISVGIAPAAVDVKPPAKSAHGYGRPRHSPIEKNRVDELLRWGTYLRWPRGHAMQEHGPCFDSQSAKNLVRIVLESLGKLRAIVRPDARSRRLALRRC